MPVLRGKRAVGDKSFAGRPFQRQLRACAARSCIPPKRGLRPSGSFHQSYYRQRHHLKNFFCRIKRFPGISTRYDKLALTLLAFVQFGAVLDWLSHQV